jgi:hypothetical protein
MRSSEAPFRSGVVAPARFVQHLTNPYRRKLLISATVQVARSRRAVGR